MILILPISCPENCFPSDELLEEFKFNKIKTSSNPEESVVGADVIITDTWVSMGMSENAHRLKNLKTFKLIKIY